MNVYWRGEVTLVLVCSHKHSWCRLASSLEGEGVDDAWLESLALLSIPRNCRPELPFYVTTFKLAGCGGDELAGSGGDGLLDILEVLVTHICNPPS